ncbi:hypothetical protein DFJ73DRAFT_827151 [Zopfochytrium polystomum]|nr:hypothetical protein DFJ73DRAFT_827151 [Zopfochytrium polystomum]
MFGRSTVAGAGNRRSNNNGRGRGGRIKTVEDALEKKMAANPYFPYYVHERGLEFSVRNTTLYVAVFFLIAGFVGFVYTICGNYLDSAFFMIPVFVVVVSLAAIWNYKDTRHYMLFPTLKQYAFTNGSNVRVRGEYYNIYIRLRKEVRSGAVKLYYLVLNGYQIDSRRLCGSTKNCEKLRKLGQQIAANLNLNYFDEANTSPHHVIRHFRSDKQVFSFRKPSYREHSSASAA